MLRDRASNLHRAMIVAMVAVGVMKPAIHEVIHVIAVRHRFMPTAGTVFVLPVVLHLCSELVATIWIRFA